MKMMFVLAATLSLSSCAANWTRPEGTPAMLAADKAQCGYEAEAATAGIEDPVRSGVRAGFMEVSCLRARGWTNGR